MVKKQLMGTGTEVKILNALNVSYKVRSQAQLFRMHAIHKAKKI